MRYAIFVSVCMLVGTALAAPLPIEEVSTCGIADAIPCVSVVIGDVIVHDGETEQYNNGTYTFQGNVTVEPGGTVEMILSNVSFGDESPVHVQAGGTIVIDSSTLRGSATEGAHTPILQLDAGAIVTIVDSDFTTLTVSVGSDNATIHDNTFQLGFPALLFEDWDGELYETTFSNNIEGINATGGAPTFHDVFFFGDSLGMRLDGVQCVIQNFEMTDVQDGILLTGGACVMSSFALNDQALPPDVGIEILSGEGQTSLTFGSITQFGTGVFYCDADVVMQDMEFGDNGQDVDSCDA